MPPITTNITQMFDPTLYKRCRRCREVRLFSEFSPNIRNNDGVGSYCKICVAKATLRRRRTNPERVREENLCNGCNSVIRWAGNSPKRLELLADYVRQGGERANYC